MNLIALAILAPSFGLILILLLRKIPQLIALLAVVIGLFASVMLFVTFSTSNGAELPAVVQEIIFSGLPNMPLRLIASPLSTLLSTMVAVVATLVMVYAVGYMKHDIEQTRFYATMLLFVMAMQLFVFAGDWILLLSAWELIGLSSYLLIGFWYRKPNVKEAAMRAFLITRSADLGLYIAIFILIASTGSSEIAASLNSQGTAAISAGIFLLIAAMGKSAQTPLHDWLQRAMAGPTPVSALLHSATLVAAGAILLIRSAPLLPPEVLLIVGIVGGITTIVTGIIALTETDLKRVLAASTSSQYGLMLLAIAAGVPLAALLHLLAHAAIKSSLFLGAGVFQHSRDTTKLQQLHGIAVDHPRIFFGFAIAALALAGIPPLSGFFSKDAIIAATMNSSNAAVLLPFVLVGTILTGAYMARVLRILSRSDVTHNNNKPAITGLTWMATGFVGLVSIAVILGASFSTLTEIISPSLNPLNMINGQLDNSEANFVPEILGLIMAISGLFLGWFFQVQKLPGFLLPWSRRGFSIAGGFDTVVVAPVFFIANACNRFESVLYQGILSFGRLTITFGHVIRAIDERFIDTNIYSFVRGTVKLGGVARALQSGFIHKELAISTIIITFIIVFMLVMLWL